MHILCNPLLQVQKQIEHLCKIPIVRNTFSCFCTQITCFQIKCKLYFMIFGRPWNYKTNKILKTCSGKGILKTRGYATILTSVKTEQNA